MFLPRPAKHGVTLQLSSQQPTHAPLHKCSGETSGKYIIKVKDDVVSALGVSASGDGQAALLHEIAGCQDFVSAQDVTESYQLDGFNAFVVSTLDEDKLNAIRAISNVEYIEEDGIMSTCDQLITQNNAPWGLARLSSAVSLKVQDASLLNFTYTYDSSAGSGVDVYVVDTGIYTDHRTFGGRAKWGKTFGGYKDADNNGHGTHCAGTVAGEQFGVAKSANLIAVKVLSDEGKGNVSDIISGLSWVSSQASASGRPTVVSMSLGGGLSNALDSAVKAIIKTGVHVIVAAGNDNDNVLNHSPARVESAITVGASNIADSRSSFSNWGLAIDVFAPGEDIISAGIQDPNDQQVKSGTSMATPHVAGLAAYLVSKDGNTSPADLSKKIKGLALKGVLNAIPGSTSNYLAQNGSANA